MTKLHLLDIKISWVNEKIYIRTFAPFHINTIMLALSEVRLCLARNYDYDDKTRSLSWTVSLVDVNCAVDRYLHGR